MGSAVSRIWREERQALGVSALIFLFYFVLAVKSEFLISFAVCTGLVLALAAFLLLLHYPGYTVAIMIVGTALDQLGRIPGTPITVFHLGFLLCALIWLVQLLRAGQPEFHTTNFNLPLLLFLGWISFSLIYTPDRGDAAVHFLRLLALVFTMYLTINVIRERATLAAALGALILSAFALSAYALSSLGATSTSLMQLAVGFSKVFGRFGATFENPNYFATFLMLALAISGSLIINRGAGWLLQLMLLAASGVILVALVGTFSRAAWVALIPAALFVTYFSRYRNAIFIVASVTIMLAVVLLWESAFVQSFVMRFASLSEASSDPSSMTRLFLFRGGWQMLEDSWFMGVGYRAFPVLYQQHYIPHNQTLFDVFESHTLPMEVLAELGLVGLFLFAWFNLRYFQYAWRAIHRISSPFLRASLIGVVAAMIGYYTNALFSPGQLSGNFLWLGFGLTYAIPRLEQVAGRQE